MESLRWLRFAPLAILVAAGAAGNARPVAGAGAERPWEPPPCPAGETGDPPGAAWYRLEPALDATGTLAGMRLTVGIDGTAGRHLDLGPESFASGPTGGRILVGEDDGALSRLSALDAVRGCSMAIAEEASVIRSAVMAPDGEVAVRAPRRPPHAEGPGRLAP